MAVSKRNSHASYPQETITGQLSYCLQSPPLGEGGRERGWAAIAMGPEGNKLSERISVKY